MQTANANQGESTLQQLARAKEEARATAKTGEGGNPNGQTEELPQGTSTVEASAETPVTEESAAEEPVVETSAPKTLIRIGGQTFETEAEAEAYVMQLERDKLSAESHAAGVREALEFSRQPQAPIEPQEDKFEEEFYANPKETLKRIQAQAVADAEARIDQKLHRERLWNTFLNDYPDVRRKDAERILQENFDLFEKITDIPKAMKLLAHKTREEYEEIRNLGKPRTELPPARQAVSPSGGAQRSVTLPKKEDAPLTMAEQLRRLKAQG